MIDIDEQMMRLALAEARQAAEEGEIPVGAVVCSGRQILARTHNLTERLTDVTAHAEMQAITAAAAALGGKYLTDCTLYVTLEPCTMCAGALGWSQLGRLVYGAADPRRGFTQTSPTALHPKTKIEQGICEAECLALLQEFFQHRRSLRS